MSKTGLCVLVSSIGLCATFGGACAQSLSIEVLSSRPELVSSGSALIRITGASGAPAVTLDGKDVSSAFKADAKSGFVGLIEGLKDGDNRLVAKGGGREASLTLR